jgi:hypothetical protein
MSVHLRLPEVVEVAKRLLLRLHTLCDRRHGTPPPSGSGNVIRVRVFMAAFLIAIYPDNCLEGDGVPEREVLEISSQLYIRFERIARVLVGNKGDFRLVSSSMTRDFVPMLFQFFQRFDAWKLPDSVKMRQRIIKALDGLHATKDSVVDSTDPQCVTLRQNIDDHIGQLRTRLIQLGGLSALFSYDENRSRQVAERERAMLDEGLLGFVVRSGPMCKEQLAHELHLNPLFKFGDHDGQDFDNGVFGQVCGALRPGCCCA